MTGRHSRSTLVILLAMVLGLSLVAGTASVAQTQSLPQADPKTNQADVIQGTATVGTLPLQGVRVTASNARTGKQVTTATDATGLIPLPSAGLGVS